MEYDQIIIEPVLTEKSFTGRPNSCYVFRVNMRATKVAIRQAIEKAFKVKVKDVNTLFVKPKARSLGRSIGRTASWKKAYVTLIAGQKIQELEV
ncbi:50S ribosomal protein L23 [candidate division WOR-1 bacterium RIFOXYB2_FULL_48_7]|uniref:Large ribosomal subunit protein uL23 n=1 Tax=candidate division WOR-1 bacterium RIFOXYB2_FULL_48_7 TaxID=1802583 RepID=A0A1F4TP36_UNCSA|nr:MAG: 50S ribosomal protein L23 [candidate division WOR-1 bacterium RIFOXYB2_FULL_48_7]